MKPFAPVLALAAVASPLLAADPFPLEPVVVTTTRSEQAASRLPASVRVITAAEIAASGARHLADLLRMAGGIQVTDFYGDGSRAQLDARAFGDAANANTLVLVDGRPLNNPDIAAPDLGGIALGDVEQVEIIEGAAGALYGDQATAAVINVVTRIPHATAASVEALAGSDAASGVRAAAALAQGGVTARLAVETRAGDNYRDHNRLEQRNALVRTGYRWPSGHAFAEAGAVEQDLETPGALFADEVADDRRQSTANFRNDFSDTDTRLYRIGGAQSLGANSTWRLEATRRTSDGSFRLSSAAFGPAPQDAFQARTIDSLHPRVIVRLPGPAGEAELTVGGDLLRADYLLRSQFGAQSNQQRQQDGYAQAIVPVAAEVDVTVGARSGRVRNTVIDGFTFTQPTTFREQASAGQFGAAWRPLTGVRLFARADRSYRHAKVDEFTFTSAGFGSNQNVLRPQRGDTIELGADWTVSGVAVTASVFRVDTDDEIAFDPAGGPFGFGANVNLPSTRRDGALLRAQTRLFGSLTLSAGGQYIDAEVTAGPLRGRDVPLAAAVIAHGTATMALPAGVTAQAGVQYTGRRALAGDFDNSLPALPPHAAAHVALNLQHGPWTVSLRGDNVLDREYSEYGAAGLDPSFNEAPAYLPSPGARVSALLRREL